MTSQFKIPVLFLLATALIGSLAQANVLTVEDLLMQKDEWSSWANEKKKIQLTGRLHARVATRLHLQNLDIVFVPERGINIPDKLRSGHRLTISGRLTEKDSNFEFRVTRFLVGSTDREELAEAMQRLSDDAVDERYALADKFERIANFYDDSELLGDVQHARLETLAAQRRLFHNNADQLWTLVDPGPGFDYSQDYREALTFQVMLIRSQDAAGNLSGDEIRQHLPGWQHSSSRLSDENLKAWERDAVAFYNGADPEVRRQLERLLYTNVRRREIQLQMKPDFSNGLELSRQYRDEFPEDQETANDLKAQYAQFRLRSVEQLNRANLQEVVNILKNVGRTTEAQQAVNDWTDYQASQFGERGLEGQIRVADEYLFAWDKWNDEAHRSAAIEYLKRAWDTASQIAPDEAKLILSRLENLGWTRLHNQWITTDELKNVPSNDIELAQKEGRVVAGMTPKQVSRILGEPTRRIQAASSRYVEDIWVYGERHSSRIIVRLRRSTAERSLDARVVSVFQLAR